MDLASSSSLPPGWTATTLGQLLVVLRGVTYDKQQVMNAPGDGFVPVLRATNIAETLNFNDMVYVPARFVSQEQYLQAGDIVVAASSGSASVVGKAAPLLHNWHGSFGAFCYGLRPSTLVEPKYLSFFLQTSEYRHQVSALAAGVNINNLRRNHIEGMGITLAPIPEQHRIVAEIERQFSLLDAGVANLKRVQANLKRYRAAVLQAACTGQLVPTEAELAKTEGRTCEPAAVLLTRILAERRARWEAEQWAKKKGQSKASGHDLFSGNEGVSGLEHLTLNQGASASPHSSPLSPELVARGQSAAEPLTFNESVLGLDTLGVAAGSVVNQLFRKQEGAASPPSSPIPLELGARGPLLKGYKEPAAPDTSGLPELPEGWVWASLSMMTNNIGDVDHKMPKAVTEGIPYISTKDFQGENEIDFDRAKRISIEDYLALCRKIKPVCGDLLLSRYGTVGEVRRVRTEQPFQASYSVAILKMLTSQITTEYVLALMRSSVIQTQIKRGIRATAQPDLGLDHIRKFAVPLPPLAEQSRIVAEVERRLSVVDNLEQVVKANLKRAERLRQAVLKEAFAGRLVPQDPADEPASVLLERIKAEREASRVGGQPLRRYVARNGKQHQEQSDEVTQNLFSAEVTN